MSEIQGGTFISGFAAGVVSSLVSSAISASGETGELTTNAAGKSIAASNNFGNSPYFKAVMIASGGLSGGISSSICGGKFTTGFMQGVIVAGMNHLAYHIATLNASEMNSQNNRKSTNKAEILDPNASQSMGAKAGRILSAMVSSDSNKTFCGKAIQIASHFTWELPQQFLAVLTGEISNVFGCIESVYKYSNGAVVLNNPLMFEDTGFTMGNVITVGSGSSYETLSHEFGHYVQSQTFGPMWGPMYGIPSIVRAGLWNFGIIGGSYDSFYTEQNATLLGNIYSGFKNK